MIRFLSSALVCALGASSNAPTAAAAAPTLDRDASYLDDLFTRTYTGDTPLRSVGENLWTAHPVGWGFANEIHYVHYDNFGAFTVEPVWDGVPLTTGAAWIRPNHLETWSSLDRNLLFNNTSQGVPTARVNGRELWLLVDGDRNARAHWGIAPNSSKEAIIDAELDAKTSVSTLVLSLVAEDGLVLPDAYRVEWMAPSGWEPVEETSRLSRAIVRGLNRVAFKPVATKRMRVVFTAAEPVGVSEIELYAPGHAPVDYVERKLIARDDVLIAVIDVRNLHDEAKTLSVTVASPIATTSGPVLTGSIDLVGIPIALRLAMTGATADGPRLVRNVTLAPGQQTRIPIAMSFARSPGAAKTRLEERLGFPSPVTFAVTEFYDWFFSIVPQVDLPDPYFDKMYAFRWLVTLRNLSEPKTGRLQHPTFMEGRWGASWYPEPITYGAPHQLREIRWLRDPRYVRGHMMTFIDNQRPDGAFFGARVTGERKAYTDWIAAALWEVFLVTGDTELVSRSLDAMERNLAYVSSRDADGDALPLVTDHFETGMEWQPAFWYFNNFLTDKSTPLERVDYAAAFFANARATGLAANAMCESDRAESAQELAERVRSAVETKMWDDASRFYYSLRETDDAKAMVREIVGYYPFAFGLSPASREDAFRIMFDPAEFGTPWPPASSALSSPATSQDGWPIGAGGSLAMWNGPTWPHAISVVGDAISKTIRRSGEGNVTREQLFTMLESYTTLQYCCNWTNRDINRPIIGEFYHGESGQRKTNEIDYFHSTYADLIITKLIGLEPTAERTIRVDPLLPPGKWDRFFLDSARVRGHDVTVVWDEIGGDDAYDDGFDGFQLYVDGTLAATRSDLGPLEWAMPEPRLFAVKETGNHRARLIVESGAPPWTPFRSTSASMTGAVPVPGSPHEDLDVVDTESLSDTLLFYRAGACGPGL